MFNIDLLFLPQQKAPFFTRMKGDVVWIYG